MGRFDRDARREQRLGHHGRRQGDDDRARQARDEAARQARDEQRAREERERQARDEQRARDERERERERQARAEADRRAREEEEARQHPHDHDPRVDVDRQRLRDEVAVKEQRVRAEADRQARAVGPSCRGRRMADAAAHLLDRVLPTAPYRPWTLSVPWRLRILLARDRTLLSRALGCFVRAVFRWQRAQARALGIVGAAPGAGTAIQRFGSVLNLNVHFHTLVPDGVFVATGVRGARFVPLPATSAGRCGSPP